MLFRSVNQCVADTLPRLEGRLFVVHQTGRDWTPLADTPWYASRPYFQSEMPDLYAGADLLFGRAGAGTLWEAAATGVPLVLLPLGAGSRGDQVRNAELFASRGAARVLDSGDPVALVSALEGFLDHPEARQRARTALAEFDAAGAADRIAAAVLGRHPEVARV